MSHVIYEYEHNSEHSRMLSMNINITHKIVIMDMNIHKWTCDAHSCFMNVIYEYEHNS